MYTDSEGIILRQTKTLNGRRMISVFTDKYGKISAGTSISEKGKTKSSLALSPFTLGRYELYKNRDSYTIAGAEVIESFFRIGEDIDKYLAASQALETADLILAEEQPSKGLFVLLSDFLRMLSERNGSYETLLLAYKVRCLAIAGCGMELFKCASCGKDGGEDLSFSVPAGGLICPECRKAHEERSIAVIDKKALYALRFMKDHPIKSLRGLALDGETAAACGRIIKEWYSYHLGIENLKSEGFSL